MQSVLPLLSSPLLSSPISMFSGQLIGTHIKVDNFNEQTAYAASSSSSSSSSSPSSSSPCHFFLTHYHADHLCGLSATWIRGNIYCSIVTKHFLLLDYPALRSRVVGLALEHPHPLPLPRELATTKHSHYHVSLFDANHCAGSVILVFQGPWGVLVHSGDFCYSPLSFHHPALHAVIGTVETLYCDVTFAHEQTLQLPTKTQSIQHACTLIQAYLNYFQSCTKRHTHSHTQQGHITVTPLIYLCCDMLGTEELLISICTALNLLLYLSPDLSARHKQLSILKQTHHLLTDCADKTPLHAAKGRGFQSFALQHQLQRKQLQEKRYLPALYIKPSTMWYVQSKMHRKQKIHKEKQEHGLYSLSDTPPDTPPPLDAEEQQQTVTMTATMPTDTSTTTITTTADSFDFSHSLSCLGLHLPPDCHQDRFGVCHILYSMHSSLYGIMQFIQLLQPRFVIPINIPVYHNQSNSTQQTQIEEEDGCYAEQTVSTLEPGAGVTRVELQAEVVGRLQQYVRLSVPNHTILVMSAAQLQTRHEMKLQQMKQAPTDADKTGTTSTIIPPRPPHKKEQHQPPQDIDQKPASIVFTATDNPVDSLDAKTHSVKKSDDDEVKSSSSSHLTNSNQTDTLNTDSHKPHRLRWRSSASPPPAKKTRVAATTAASTACNIPGLKSLPVDLFDFSKCLSSVFYIARDIRGCERQALLSLCQSSHLHVSEFFSSNVNVVLMNMARPSSVVVFHRLVRVCCRLKRDEHRRQGRIMPVTPLFVYDQRCITELKYVHMNATIAAVGAESSSAMAAASHQHPLILSPLQITRLNECFIWCSNQLSQEKIDEILQT